MTQDNLDFETPEERARIQRLAINHVRDQLPDTVVVAGKRGGRRNVAREKIILALRLIANWGRTGEGCWASEELMADAIGCKNTRTVSCCVVWLEAASLISVKRRYQDTSILKIVVPNCQEFSPDNIPWPKVVPTSRQSQSDMVSEPLEKSFRHDAKNNVQFRHDAKVDPTWCRRNDIVREYCAPPPPKKSFPTINDQRARREEPVSSIVEMDLFWSIVDRIQRFIPTSSQDDIDLIYKLAVWQCRGKISQNQIECCLETVSRKHPDNPAAYFTSAVRTQLGLTRAEMYDLIRRTPVPAFARTQLH